MNKLKQVLGIVGSPRRNGNTELLVDEVLKGAIEAGAFGEKIILNELIIKPCQACNYCTKNGKCKQKDDWEKIFEKMKQSEVWIFGTPVYWWGPSAQFKLFMDRWYGIHQTYKFTNKKNILTITLGGGEH